MRISRIGHEPFEITRGLEVDIFIDNTHKTKGKVTGISEARGIIKCGNLEYEAARIYPAGTFIKEAIDPNEAKKQNLSKSIHKANIKHEPPGGWSENDKLN